MGFSKSMYESELAEYYDVMRQYRDYDKECQFADDLIQKHHPGTKKVLDICCGTGEHAIRMTKLGYEVTGIDLSPDMLKLAAKKAKRADVSIEFRCTDVNELDFKARFQAAYCLGYTFLYMTTDSKVMNFFAAIRKSLSTGGLLLVDFINGLSLIKDFQRDKFMYQHDNTTIFQFEQSSLDKARRIKHIEFYYFIDHHDGHMKTIFAEEDLRIFYDDEVQALMLNSGFENADSFGDYTLKPKDSSTPYIVIATGQKGASEWNTKL